MIDYNDGKIHGWNGDNLENKLPKGVHPKSKVKAIVVGKLQVGINSWLEDYAGSLRWTKIGSSVDIVVFQVTEVYKEPVTLWANVYPDGNVGLPYSTKDEAVSRLREGGVVKQFKEVIE